MDGVPADAMPTWMALTLVSAAFLGIALTVPSAPPPDATALAATVNAVAASPHASSDTHTPAATEIRLGSRRVALRNDAGSAHAVFLTPVTPVPSPLADGPLAAVLHGASARDVFASPAAFAQAATEARNRTAEWRSVRGRLVVRHVHWEEVDVTLVGA